MISFVSPSMQLLATVDNGFRKRIETWLILYAVAEVHMV